MVYIEPSKAKRLVTGYDETMPKQLLAITEKKSWAFNRGGTIEECGYSYKSCKSHLQSPLVFRDGKNSLVNGATVIGYRSNQKRCFPTGLVFGNPLSYQTTCIISC